MARTLEEELDEVTDETSFLRFVRALADDYEADREEASRSPPSPYAPGPRGWENLTVGHYLESAAAWADAKPRPSDQNPWRRCAQILYAAKSYE